MLVGTSVRMIANQMMHWSLSFAIQLFLGSLFILFLYNILFAIRGCSSRRYFDNNE